MNTVRCLNCHIQESSMWRHGHCNACWVYYKRKGEHKNVSVIYAKILLDLNK